MSVHGINLVLNGIERVPVSLEQSDVCGRQGEEEQVAGRGVPVLTKLPLFCGPALKSCPAVGTE